MRKLVTATVFLSFALLVTIILLLRNRQVGSSKEVPSNTRSVSRIETRRLDGNRWVVSRLDKDTYLKDLAGVTKQITLKPNPGKDPDSVADVSILKVTEESPMYAAGFRKDDRILKVNGTSIGTMGRAVNLVHEIKASSRLTVQVQRGSEIIDYQFDFE